MVAQAKQSKGACVVVPIVAMPLPHDRELGCKTERLTTAVSASYTATRVENVVTTLRSSLCHSVALEQSVHNWPPTARCILLGGTELATLSFPFHQRQQSQKIAFSPAMSQSSDDHPLDLSLTKPAAKPELLLALPDVPTVAILSFLPLQQLIVDVPLVHPRLAHIRENALEGTQRLVLLIGDQSVSKQVKIASRIARHLVDSTGKPLCTDPNWCELDQFRLATLDRQAVKQLSSLMPAIVHLQVVISHAHISVLSQLTILLSNWAPTLQTLQLHIGKWFFVKKLSERPGLERASRFIVSFKMRSLLQSINRKFVALQHLTLDVGKLTDDAEFANEFLYRGEMGVPLSLPILGQLKEFHLHLGKCENGHTFLLEALKKHDTEKLTNIGLNGVHFEKPPRPDLLTLPDVPTLAILSLLPLRQLIVNVPMVHPRLAPFRQSVLKSTQRLVLHIGDQQTIKQVNIASRFAPPFVRHLVDSTGEPLVSDANTWSECDQLHLSILNYKAVEQLSSLMPGIVHLQVVISDIPKITLSHMVTLQQLAILLANWAPSLQTLQLTIGQFYFNKLLGQNEELRVVVTSNMRLLIQSINRKFVALQHLTLDIGKLTDDAQFADEFLFGGETGVPLDLSILRQLKEFYLHLGKCPKGQSFLLDALEKYATEKLTSIGLGGDFEWNWDEVANSQFAARFTTMPFNRSSTSHTVLRSFSNLTAFEFNWRKLSALELVDHLRLLSSLPNLQYLQVNSFAPISHPPPLTRFIEILSLSSVTVLEIGIDPEDKDLNHLQSPYWETLFPSVQILKVKHCGKLHYLDEYWTVRGEKEIIVKIEKISDYFRFGGIFLLKQLFAPLRVLPSLRKIFYQPLTLSDFIAEFTQQGEFVCTHECAHIG